MKPLLVTGAHRTATTWVGRILAADPRRTYISEPFSAIHRPGVMRAKVPWFYLYLCEENEGNFLPAVNEMLAYHYHPAAELMALRSGRDILRMGRDWAIFLNGWLRRNRPVIKDPFTVFSIDWFIRRLGCRAVVTVRHPAGFASSLKRLNWPFNFRDLLEQPLLMRDHLEPYRGEMEGMPADDIIGQAGLLWKMVYCTVHELSLKDPGVTVVRHEDLSRDPLGQFRKLYEDLGLEFTEGVERRILSSSSSENPRELSRKNVHSVKLDSRANLDNWKRRLSAEEIGRLRQITGEAVQLYYPEAEWS